MTDGVFAKSKEEMDQEEDPFDDIWVPSVYIVLKVFEAKNPVQMWKKAEYHRKANKIAGRPYWGAKDEEVPVIGKRKTVDGGVVHGREGAENVSENGTENKKSRNKIRRSVTDSA
jgi:hypothetical protein